MIEHKGVSLVIKKVRLSTLKGIGLVTAEKLVKAGYDSIETLAKARPERLQEIPGIGAKFAIALVYEANYHLGANEEIIAEPVREEVVEPVREELIERIREEMDERIREEVIEPVKEDIVEPIREVAEPIREERKEMEEEKVTTFREALLMAKRREMTQFKSQVRSLQAKMVLGEISRDRFYSRKQGYDDEIRDLEEQIIAPPTVNPAVTNRMRSSIIKQKIISLEKQLLQKAISPARFFELRDKYERELRTL